MENSNSDLRAQLQHITEAGKIVEQHPKLIQDLALKFPHSIEHVPNLGPQIPIDCYNCFEFALGVAGHRDVKLISQSFRDTCLNSDFIDYLARLGLVPTVASYSDGSIVLYRDSQCFTHAGRIHRGHVISKWGAGHLWWHDFLEVPQNYGDFISFHFPPEPDAVLDAFVNFARQREGAEIVTTVLGR